MRGGMTERIADYVTPSGALYNATRMHEGAYGLHSFAFASARRGKVSLAAMAASDLFPARVNVTNLCLERGGHRLLSGVCLSAAAGEALILRGPNGSGKTTLLRALAGLVRPEAGELDLVPRPPAFLGHADALKRSETVEQTLVFQTWLQGGDTSRLGAVMKQQALAHLARRTAGTLSAGQRRRTALAGMALSNRPIWLLDEPAASLDARSRNRLAELVKSHCAAGGIVIASTHVDLDWEGARVRDLHASTSARAHPAQPVKGLG